MLALKCRAIRTRTNISSLGRLKISPIRIFPQILFPKKELKNTAMHASHLYRGFILNEVLSDKVAQNLFLIPFKEMDF